MKKKIKKIEVITLPNGYSLKFDGMTQSNGFMYFTAEELLEGFMAHIGLEMTDQLNMETIKDFIVTAINWRDNKACVNEIQRLTSEIHYMTVRTESLKRQVVSERKRYMSVIADIKILITELKKNPSMKYRLEKILNGQVRLSENVKPLTLNHIEKETNKEQDNGI